MTSDEHIVIVKDFFKWTAPNFCSGSVSMKLYRDTIGSDLNDNYPVDVSYCVKFCRYLLNHVENEENEIADREELKEILYNKVGELYCSPKDDSVTASFRTYFLSSSHPEVSVSMRESRAMISSGTTGLTSWTAGECLSSWLDRNPDVVSGKTVLELGAGSGITGIFAVTRCSDIVKYIFSDCHVKVLDNLMFNVGNNLKHWNIINDTLDGLELMNNQAKVVVRDLDWITFSEDPDKVSDIVADVILGADIVFDPELLPSLVLTIKILLSRSQNSLAVIACCVRNSETFKTFENILESENLLTSKILLKEDDKTPVYLLKIRMIEL